MLFSESPEPEMAHRGRSGALSGLLAAITLVVAGTNALAATDGATVIRAEPEPALTSVGSQQFKHLQPLAVSRLRVTLDSPTTVQQAAILSQSQMVGVPPQIGFPRDVAALGTPSATAASLTWGSLPSGGQAASFSIASPNAQGLRIGLRIYALPRDAVVRFYAVGASSAFEASGNTILGLIAQNLASGDTSEDANTYWSPVIDGTEAVVEIELPPGATRSQVKLAVPKISHLAVSATTQALGDASACNLDATCYSGTWANTSNATAKMVFSELGSTYLCSGTLLNDLDSSTQIPFFLSANHCISTQTVASTLQTYWFYRSTSCNSGVPNPGSTSVGGGATLLYHSSMTDTTDTSFMRLNAAPPAGANYAGWSVTPPSLGTGVTAVHHPMGDLQKISFGSVDAYQICTIAAGEKFFCSPSNATSGTFLEVPFTGGMTEAGSSGSGIFLAGGYLIGQLYGGGGSCGSNVGYYGRFDKAYSASLHQWLNPSMTSFGLSVALTGAGTGTVTSVPAGVSCGANCSATYASGVSVVLTATPAAGSAFGGWSGACSGTGTCTLTMDTAKSLTATFNALTTYPLAVSRSGTGTGTVTSSPSGITCGTDCSENYVGGTVVSLAATPAAGSVMAGWSGACAGTGACAVTMNSGMTATAIFNALPDDGFPAASTIPAGWVQAAGSAAPWVVTSSVYYAGSSGLKAGAISNGQYSEISYTASFSAGTISFARKVSSEAGFDFLQFRIDGIVQNQWSGEVDWSVVSFPLSAGTHTVSWRYAKDPTLSSGNDTAWIDSVSLPGSTASIQPQDGLWAIDAEVNGQNGRGFQIETHNGLTVLTYYGYRAGGHDHWYLATGSLSNGSFSGSMTQYQGGTALGAPYTPATANGSAGTVTMNFTGATTGSITLPGESAKSISKFVVSGGSGSPTVVPNNGLWVIDAELNGQDGRGFQIEQNGGLLVFTYYGYDSTGQETWYLAAGAMSGSSFTSTLTEYGGGTVLGGTYAPATETGSPGQLVISFSGPITGTITLPGESPKTISKFQW
jgi:hypothetical protein